MWKINWITFNLIVCFTFAGNLNLVKQEQYVCINWQIPLCVSIRVYKFRKADKIGIKIKQLTNIPLWNWRENPTST